MNRITNLNVRKPLALVLLLLASGFVVADESSTRPNILFVFSDDHAWQAIGAYESRLKNVANTPHIDRLASEGILFKKCYVTNALCGPSRATVLTGKYGHLNGVTWNKGARFDGSQETFPKLMRAHGYQTAIIGKWHLGTTPTGFDYFDVMSGQGKYYNPSLSKGNTGGIQEKRTIKGHNSNIVGDLSIEWLKNGRDKDKPFLLMAQFKATHHGWAPAPEEYDLYDGVEIPEPDNLFDNFSFRGTAIRNQTLTIYEDLREGMLLGNPGELGTLDPEQRLAWNAYRARDRKPFEAMEMDWKDNSKDLSRFKYQVFMRNFLATGAGIDRNVGRIRDFLDESGLAKNTIVIYMSDHGFFLGEHGFFDKRFMYEESLRTAFIVHWPGTVKQGVINDEDIVSNLDIASTFLDIAGIEIPQEIQGESLVPVLKGKTPNDWRKSFLYEYFEMANHNVPPNRGVTDGRFKLIYYSKTHEWEFFDLENDPHEMVSQYYVPEYQSTIEGLKKELARLRTKYKCRRKIDISQDAEWPYEKQLKPVK